MNARSVDIPKQDGASAGAGRALVPAVGGAMALSSDQLDARRIIRHDMDDPGTADAFRDLRTQLLARSLGGSTTVLVTPVAHGRGGSFVALNLAAAMAFDDRRAVVLVDCNLRRPCLHQRLGVAQFPGLVEFLEGSVDEIGEVTHVTGIPRLYLIPAGDRREASGDLLGSSRMIALMDSLHGANDAVSVVLDATAVSAAPDARILSRLTEQSILVSAYGRDTAQAVQEASRSLDAERLAGVIFNRVPG
ncbi:MAG: CpsD/CapB family tyrosine-protein kinase [Lysobacteraceae bacterium]